MGKQNTVGDKINNLVDKAFDEGFKLGWKTAIDSIRLSLKDFPDVPSIILPGTNKIDSAPANVVGVVTLEPQIKEGNNG